MINYNTLGYILKNLNSDITVALLSEDSGYPTATINRLINIDRPYKRAPNALGFDDYMGLFKKYKQRYFGNNPQKAIAAITDILKTISIDLITLDEQFARYINTPVLEEEDFEQFIRLLIFHASLYYKQTPIPQKSDNPNIKNNAPPKKDKGNAANANIFGSDNKVEIKTYFDLQHDGLTSLDVAKQLIENDRVLFGDLGDDAGSAEQWAQHIRNTPENWSFLCHGTNIIGNWSCTFLTAEQEAAVRAGTMLGKDFTADCVANPIANCDGEVAIHLLNMSVNEGYQTDENWSLLWSSFGERLHQLAKNGIFYRTISVCLFPGDYKPIFESMGFKYLSSRNKEGDIYWLDLTYEFPPALKKIMPNVGLERLYEEHWGKPITFRQLTNKDVLTPQQEVDISNLIFSTDRYVYDAMMTREQTKRILPLVFSGKKDSMFSLENLFVAFADDRIVGLILSKKGELHWSSRYLKNIAEFLGEELPDSLDAVEKEYFTLYNIENARSIINFCINSAWCSRDMKIGSELMAAFVNAYGCDEMRLYVLRETLPTMKVYLENGFEITELCNGWSIDKRDLPCAIMVRPANLEKK